MIIPKLSAVFVANFRTEKIATHHPNTLARQFGFVDACLTDAELKGICQINFLQNGIR